jgi:hypothetical protein
MPVLVCVGLCGSVAKIITIPAVVAFYEAIKADGLAQSQETVLYVIPANSWIKSGTGAGIH